MSNLPQKTIETIKNYLTRQQKQVEKNLKSVNEDDPATAPALAESSEPGTDSWVADNHSNAVALMESLKQVGGNVKKALEKIKNGVYGKCEKCGKEIEQKRLMVFPTAELCLSCTAKKKK